MGGPTETLQGSTNLHVVSIIETVHVDVPVGILRGGCAFGSEFDGITVIEERGYRFLQMKSLQDQIVFGCLLLLRTRN